MIRLLFILLLFITPVGASEDCDWQGETPCVVISKGINNSNAIGDKVTPTSIISKKQIDLYKLYDLPRVLNFVSTVDVTQSGPTGQQTSVFFLTLCLAIMVCRQVLGSTGRVYGVRISTGSKAALTPLKAKMVNQRA